MRHQHRQCTLIQDIPGRATEDQLTVPVVVVRAHDEKIRRLTLCFTEDYFPNRKFSGVHRSRVRLNAVPRQITYETLDGGAYFVFILSLSMR